MGTSLLSSQGITDLDAVPVVRHNTGQNVPGMARVATGAVIAVSADNTSSVYKLVRLPTNAKVKSASLTSAIATAGSGDVNIAFSDATNDGTPAGARGTIPQISAANNKLFGAAISLVGLSSFQLLTAALANFPLTTAPELPLWQVLGYTADPGGFFDIQINVTTAVTTGGVVFCRVEYVV